MASTRKRQQASALRELAQQPQSLVGEAARSVLCDALASADAGAVAQAAKLIGAHALSGYEGPLAAAYREFAGERARADPGCLAKEALLAALDAAEYPDAELFAQAAMSVQLESAKGHTRDSAGRVRVRGVLGLARLGHVDVLPIFGARLADRDPAVRVATARAVAHRGQRDGAGLLLLRLGLGDEESEVAIESLRGLFALAPDLAAEPARALLRTGGRAREQALQALGSAPHDRAVELLAEALANATVAEDRQTVIEALGLSLRPGARALLLELVRGERTADAEAAVEVLAIHRYDPRLAQQVTEAASGSPTLSARVAALFKGDGR